MPAPVRRLSLGLRAASTEPGEPSCTPLELSPDTARARLQGWFLDYFDLLWRLALRLGVPRALVDDVVQEAFITAERRAADIADGSARSFLIQTTVKLSANCRRRQSHQQQLLAPLALHTEPCPTAEQLLVGKQRRQALDSLLELLPGEQRQVFVLYEIEGHSVPEIAELLELPIGTVASRLGRARDKFSKALERFRAQTEDTSPR
jgi:RNA polymerase sigma-70 factor, ECF subfamily